MTNLTKLVNGTEMPLTEEDLALLEQIEAEKEDAQWAVVRAQRNTKLAQSDWTQLPDASADAAAWAVYRQALRDITTQADPFNIVWPTAPKGS
jgi:hypothetical protein